MSMGRAKCSWVALNLFVLIGLSQTGLAEKGFTDLEGEAAQFSDYVHEDRWLVVMIWSWTCPICAKEMPGYARFHDRQTDGRLAVLGISLDGPATVMEAWGFTEEHGVTFPNLIGEAQEVAQFFYDQTGQSLQGTPTFLVYAPGGHLKAVQAGAVPPGGIEAFIAHQEGTAD